MNEKPIKKGGPYSSEILCDAIRVRQGEMPSLYNQVDTSHETYSITGTFSKGDYVMSVEGWLYLKSAPPRDGSIAIARIALMVSVLLGFGATVGCRDENSLRCTDSNADVSIGGCTALIQSGAGDNARLAKAFFYRAVAYDDKDEYDRAIQDYDQAIRLKPDFAEAFNNRGIDYKDKGQYDRAIQDYDEAVRLKPDLAEAFTNRGLAYSGMGQYDRAIQDYDQAIRLKSDNPEAFNNRGLAYKNKGQYDRALQDYDQAIRLESDNLEAFYNRGIAKLCLAHYLDAVADFQKRLSLLSSPDAYTVLWLHLARKKAGQNDAQDFAQQAGQINFFKWPAPVVNLFLGRLTPEQTLAAASNPDSIKEGEQHCAAEFFIGEYFLLGQEKSKALARFRTARDTCPHGFAPYSVATAEITRLGAGNR